ncbi:nucleotide exchange factor GrpE [Candidatus Poriferisocius sp.]|uniref:nucleotide exchange factor GrpE n=1 Tax=Candidatus Poriferisocius sp. TaxID=3101276 RepID=UPI003B029B24
MSEPPAADAAYGELHDSRAECQVEEVPDPPAGESPAEQADPARSTVGRDAGGEEPLISTEELLAQRDSYLSDLQRVTAEFANYRRKAAERQQETVAMAAAGIVEKVLPVLDACEAAVAQGAEDVAPIRDALFGALEREGLARVDETGAPFDPNWHEAVVHEPGDGEAVIAEVLRAGYRWNSRVLRPAMVKVRG